MSQAKTTKVLTADDLVGLLEKAMSKISVEKKPPRPSIDDLKKVQDEKILRRELAVERQEKVQKAVESGDLNEQIKALGKDITPLQLVKLQQQHNVPSQQHIALPPSDVGQNLMQQVLGVNPSTREMERYADIRLKLQGKGVSSNERGEIEINGYPIPNSNLTSVLRFFVKGTRGFKQTPEGATELGDLLKRSGIASSKFPESIRPFLGGRRGRRVTKHYPSSTINNSDNEELGSLTKSMEGLTVVDSDEPEQHGEGISLLHVAMDHAENGDHERAFDALNGARQLKAPRNKLKKVENYLSSLRD